MSESKSNGTTSNKFEFKAEIKKLLNILSKSLYQHQEVFLRELISNSSDALSKMRFIQLQDKEVEELPLEIEVSFDSKEKTLTVHDTGVGMTRQELIDNLGTIASSDSEKFLKSLKEATENKDKTADMDIIGQFGVGFYSVFMVAKSVRVLTKSYKKGEPAHAWESDGSGEFTVTAAEKPTRGTDITIYLRDEDADEYLSKYKLQEIIRKYSNYIPFPIFVKDEAKKEVDVSLDEDKKEGEAKEGEAKETKEKSPEAPKKEERKPVNELVPIWKRKPQEITADEYRKFYNFIAKRYDEYAHVIHYNVEGQVIFNSILFVPETVNRDVLREDVDYGLTLYTKKVLIIPHCKDLIPKWMRFVSGVVDTEDIPLNVSRDTIQNNRVVMKINDLLVKKFIGELSSIAEKDVAKYKTLWKEYGYFLKEGMVTDHSHKELITKLLRFPTSKTRDDELKGLDDYIKGMPDAQKQKKEIYYLIGETLPTMRLSPHMGRFNKEGTEVIFFSEPVDNFLMMNLHEYKVTTGEGDAKKEEAYHFVPIDTTDAQPGAGKDEANAVAGKEGEAKDDKDKDKDKDKGKKESELPPATKKFLERVKAVLGDKILDAKMSDKLYDSPYRLANPAGGMTSSMQRVMRYWTRKMQDKEFEIPRKILEFNQDHPLVQELVDVCDKDPENGRIKPVLLQILDTCLLAEGDLPDPASMVPRMNQLIEMLVRRKDDVKNPAEDLERSAAAPAPAAGPVPDAAPAPEAVPPSGQRPDPTAPAGSNSAVDEQGPAPASEEKKVVNDGTGDGKGN
ncbi:MAG: molecular chaperone HtpG [Candidatus Lokiarchaeota archaeon]|nr:molecular chaperone HtpG [Candidatus Lokiarchaeota archaeon]